jgi:16S rRNA processing protein RimM
MTDVVVGIVSGLHGVQGAMKVKSFCEPPEAIFKYLPWTLTRPGLLSSADKANPSEASAHSTLSGTPIKIRGAGHSLAARFPEVQDRDQAGLWLGSQITVPRTCLPSLAAGDYYWSDLIGLHVFNLAGVEFGVIEAMMPTGSNDVMVVNGDRQRLVPYIPGQFVINVNLAEGKLLVDWDPEF